MLSCIKSIVASFGFVAMVLPAQAATTLIFDVTAFQEATGSTATGIVGFDALAVDLEPDPEIGNFQGGFFEFTIDTLGSSGLSGLTRQSVGGLVVVESGLTGPHIFEVISAGSGSTGGQLSLLDFSQTVFADDTLPSDLNLDDFFDADLQLFDDSGSPESFVITSLSLQTATTEVPLPGALILTLSGLAGLGLLGSGAFRRRAMR